MRVVVSSDWHPDKSTAGFPRFDDVEAAAEASVDFAIRWKADRYLFLGDLCDPDSPDLIRCQVMAQRKAERMAKAHIRQTWLVGNHDVLEDGRGTTVLDVLEQVSDFVDVVSEPGFSFGIACLPYTPLSHNYDPESAVLGMRLDVESGIQDEPAIVATHLMLEGIAAGSETEDMPRGRDVFLPIDAAKKVFPGAIFLAGHYHRRQFYRGVQVVGSLANLTRADAHNTPGFLAIEV